MESQIMIMMINIRKRANLNLSGKEKVYNDVAPSGFVLPYFILRGRLSFIPTMDPPMDRIRLPAAPRRFTGEMRVSIALNRRRKGIGVTTSIAIPASYALTFCPLSLPYSHHLFFDRSFLG